jgi:hypothetical protein
MKKCRYSTLSLGLLLALIASAFAVKVGEPAPGFTSVDSNGQTRQLSDYKGKYVVLEWHVHHRSQRHVDLPGCD